MRSYERSEKRRMVPGDGVESSYALRGYGGQATPTNKRG
jgi:hypothetical protein